MGALTLRRTHLVAFAVLVTVFVALYPYLGGMGHCEHTSECPYVAQSSSPSSSASAGLAGLCLSVVLATLPAAVLVLAAFYGRRISLTELRPSELYLSLDPPPPRLFLSR